MLSDVLTRVIPAKEQLIQKVVGELLAESKKEASYWPGVYIELIGLFLRWEDYAEVAKAVELVAVFDVTQAKGWAMLLQEPFLKDDVPPGTTSRGPLGMILGLFKAASAIDIVNHGWILPGLEEIFAEIMAGIITSPGLLIRLATSNDLPQNYEAELSSAIKAWIKGGKAHGQQGARLVTAHSLMDGIIVKATAEGYPDKLYELSPLGEMLVNQISHGLWAPIHPLLKADSIVDLRLKLLPQLAANTTE